ncbi:MAG: TonB-dependent receptor [Acidobacteria bacterium]|nr:TonB-dependent receptor [Acidobacteriota bacterium]
MTRWAGVLAMVVLLGADVPLRAQTPDLTRLSLEQLLDLEVTTLSRKEQTLLRTAAAVHVLTEEDIRRSGATTLPDLFRMVPGLAVAQLNANTWSVTARGFGGTHANKLLMLIDGRSVYTPLNGGVNWEMQLLPLEAIAQIEVIRGPGGSLWGTNAINGVINIITKAAHESQGARAATHASRYQPGTVDFSYGGRFGGNGAHVTRGRYIQRRSIGLTAGRPGGDDIEAVYGRTRVDWRADADAFSFQADLQRSRGSLVESPPLLIPPYRAITEADAASTAGSAMFLWKRSADRRLESGVQVFYSGFAQVQQSQRAHTVDVDVRQRRRIGARHDVVSGLGYRSMLSAASPEATVTLRPARVREHLATTFVQDEIVVAETLQVSAGARLELSSETGVAVQPTVRALWALLPRQSVWGAVSRAVRVPDRFERGMYILADAGPGPAGVPRAITISGSTETTSAEILTSYEAGYRIIQRALSVDVAGFVGRYTDLATQVPGTPAFAEVFGVRAFQVPLIAANDAAATTRGIEMGAAWQPMPWWQLAGGYSLFDVDFRQTAGSVQAVPINGPVPRHLLHARGWIDLTGGLEAAALFYSASAIGELRIPAVNRLDLRLTWTRGRVALAAGVQNLLHAEVAEYADSTARALPGPVRVNPYGEVSWRF